VLADVGLLPSYAYGLLSRPQALHNFIKHVDRHMNKTVMSDNVSIDRPGIGGSWQ
jgi:hypothetical protein